MRYCCAVGCKNGGAWNVSVAGALSFHRLDNVIIDIVFHALRDSDLGYYGSHYVGYHKRL